MAQHPGCRHVHRSVVLIAVLYTITPDSGHADELVIPPDQILSDELQLLKEEEGIDIQQREEPPVSPSSSEPYVMVEEDIRQSGAEDLTTLFRRILSFDAPRTTGSDINRRARVDDQPIANNLLVLVDGRSTYVDASDALTWVNIPVTLPEITRLEMWKESASPIHGVNESHIVIKITTKIPGK